MTSPHLPDNPETYSVLGTFGSGAPATLAGKRLFGNDQGLMYVEFFGPIAIQAALDLQVAGHIEWADGAAKERVLLAARAEFSAALEKPRGSASPVPSVGTSRELVARGGKAFRVVLMLIIGLCMVQAFAILNHANRLTQQAQADFYRAEREMAALTAEDAERRQDASRGEPPELPPSKEWWTESAFLRVARNRFRDDKAAMACIGRIQRVDVPEKGVVDIYTTAWPPDVREIVKAIQPEVFGDEEIVVNIRNAFDKRILEQDRRDPASGTTLVTFP